MTLPKISVVVPSFNQSTTLEATILSVVNQSYSNVELIIIDGGSSDGSVEIVKKYTHHISYWISEPDEGIYHALNKGVKIATGDWLFFLGTDDMFRGPDVLRSIFKKPEHFDYDVLYGKYVNVKYNVVKPKGEVGLQEFLSSNLCHQSIFYRKHVFDRLGLYDQKYSIFADAEFNMRWFSDSRVKRLFLDEVICNYGGDGISSKAYDRQYSRDYLMLVRRHFGISPTDRVLSGIHTKLFFLFYRNKENGLAFRQALYTLVASRFSGKSIRSFSFFIQLLLGLRRYEGQ